MTVGATEHDGRVAPESSTHDPRHYRREGMTLIELAPTRCPNGHQLGPERCLVGRAVCCQQRHHRTWQCVECQTVAVWPPCREHADWVTVVGSGGDELDGYGDAGGRDHLAVQVVTEAVFAYVASLHCDEG